MSVLVHKLLGLITLITAAVVGYASYKDEARTSHVTVHEGTLSMLIGQAILPESADWVISNMALHHVEDIPNVQRLHP